MNESSDTNPEPLEEGSILRCPNCDSVVTAGDTICLMCGVELSAEVDEINPISSEVVEIVDQAPPLIADPVEEMSPGVMVSVMRERQSSITFWFTAVFAVIIIVLGALVLRFQGPAAAVFLMPSETPFPPTLTYTPTWTPLPTETAFPTKVPTITPTLAPSETPRPPRPHIVNSGETLIGLALRYRVSVESIAALNEFSSEAPIQVGQTLEIPWPSPTPPLVSVAVTVRGVNVVADPTNCDRHEVQAGDSISGIAAQNDIDFELLMRVNRLTEDSIIQPGDTVCIPKIIIGGVLPATPGPSPTTTPTSPPLGPNLLYPIRNANIDPADGIVALQWTAVKDLSESEWYMVEITDLDEVDSLPRRGFTRDNSFQVPNAWRPTRVETHLFRWRVSIVQVTGQRADGPNIYTYGGESSEEAFFTWLGAVPTPTPEPSPTVTPQP